MVAAPLSGPHPHSLLPPPSTSYFQRDITAGGQIKSRFVITAPSLGSATGTRVCHATPKRKKKKKRCHVEFAVNGITARPCDKRLGQKSPLITVIPWKKKKKLNRKHAIFFLMTGKCYSAA